MPQLDIKPIFISHATADKDLANAVVDVLGSAMEIKVTEQVFCSSARGCGIPAGVGDFKEYIRNQLQQPKIVLILVTQNFMVSPFCWAEAGVCWGKGHVVIPIAVHPIKRSELTDILKGVQAGSITDPEYWNEIFDKFGEILNVKTKQNRWESKRDELIDKIKALIKTQSAPDTISLSKYQKKEEELKEANERLTTIEEAHERLEKLNEQLKKAKNADEVAELELSSLPENKQFGKLLSNVHRAFKSIPRVCEDALFYDLTRDLLPWGGFGKEDTDAEIRQAIEDDMLEGEEGMGGVSVNSEDPKMERAQRALAELSHWIDHASGSFKSAYVEKYDHQLKLTSRRFWGEHIR